jgi:hypothetical protein
MSTSCLVFIWTAISVIIVAVFRGIFPLATLGRGKECTLCRDGSCKLWNVKDLRDLLDEIRRISVAELVPLLSEGVVLVRDEY